jgi:hypothetical protein
MRSIRDFKSNRFWQFWNTVQHAISMKEMYNVKVSTGLGDIVIIYFTTEPEWIPFENPLRETQRRGYTTNARGIPP